MKRARRRLPRSMPAPRSPAFSRADHLRSSHRRGYQLPEDLSVPLRSSTLEATVTQQRAELFREIDPSHERQPRGEAHAAPRHHRGDPAPHHPRLDRRAPPADMRVQLQRPARQERKRRLDTCAHRRHVHQLHVMSRIHAASDRFTEGRDVIPRRARRSSTTCPARSTRSRTPLDARPHARSSLQPDTRTLIELHQPNASRQVHRSSPRTDASPPQIDRSRRPAPRRGKRQQPRGAEPNRIAWIGRTTTARFPPPAPPPDVAPSSSSPTPGMSGARPNRTPPSPSSNAITGPTADRCSAYSPTGDLRALLQRNRPARPHRKEMR